MESSVPPEWITEAIDAIQHPEKFKYVAPPDPEDHRNLHLTSEKERQLVILPVLKEFYDTFHTRALAHARTKGEHEAWAMVNWYVIWRYRLFRGGGYDSWKDYLGDITTGPFSVSESTIHHRVLQLDSALEKGMTIENAIRVFGNSPTAGKKLLETPLESMPGGDINTAADVIADMGPREANRAVNDWNGEPTINSLAGIHDSTNSRVYIDARKTMITGEWVKVHYTIMDVGDKAEAIWIMNGLRVRPEDRVFK